MPEMTRLDELELPNRPLPLLREEALPPEVENMISRPTSMAPPRLEPSGPDLIIMIVPSGGP